MHALRDGCVGHRRGGGRLAEGAHESARPRVHRRLGARAHRPPRRGPRDPLLDWTFREGDEHYQKYCGTAPEHLLFGLRRALELLFEEGMENVFRRHALLADATRAAVAAWAEGGAVEFNATEPSERADSLTTVRFNGFDARELSALCRDHCGVVLGYGIGGAGMGERAIRIAHMGHVNAPMMLGILGVVETGLVALGIPQGSRSGVAAAAARLGEALAREELPSPAATG